MLNHESVFIMAFQLDLDYAADLAPHEFERFASLIDPGWINEALHQSGTVSLRRRRLPAERMVWLTIGLAPFRNEPIWHIVQQPMARHRTRRSLAVMFQ